MLRPAAANLELLGLDCLDEGPDVRGEVLDSGNDAVRIGRRGLGCCLSIAGALVDGLVQCALCVLNRNDTEKPTAVAVHGGGQNLDIGVNGGNVAKNGGSISSPNGKCRDGRNKEEDIHGGNHLEDVLDG
jgi:hypothetical protein